MMVVHVVAMSTSTVLVVPVSRTVLYSYNMHERAHRKFACWRAPRASKFFIDLSRSGGKNRLTAVP